MNCISPISFGKIVKANVPHRINEEIVRIASQYIIDSPLAKDINDVFDDKDKNGVMQYKNYFLSGDDLKYMQLMYLTCPTLSNYEYAMNLYIATKKHIPEMTVAHNGHFIKAIDIVV